MDDHQRNALMNFFRVTYVSEVQAARQLRRAERSLNARILEQKKREVRGKLNSTSSSEMSLQLAQLSNRRTVGYRRSLRANNLVRAFLRGTPYEMVESKLHPSTLRPELIIEKYLCVDSALKKEIIDNWLKPEVDAPPAEVTAET